MTGLTRICAALLTIAFLTGCDENPSSSKTETEDPAKVVKGSLDNSANEAPNQSAGAVQEPVTNAAYPADDTMGAAATEPEPAAVNTVNRSRKGAIESAK